MATSIFAKQDRRLTTQEVAARLGVTQQTVYNWAATGRLPCIRMSRRAIRFSEADIEKFEKLHTTGRL